jgi:hypothetical protein
MDGDAQFAGDPIRILQDGEWLIIRTYNQAVDYAQDMRDRESTDQAKWDGIQEAILAAIDDGKPTDAETAIAEMRRMVER